MIEFKQGYTRRVILIGPFAIKFAKIGLWYLIEDVLTAIAKPKWFRQKILAAKKDKQGVLLTILQHGLRVVHEGIRANKQEKRLYEAHPKLPLAKVYGTLFGGIILIMARGQQVTQTESHSLRASYIAIGNKYQLWGDLEIAHHVCRFGTELRYIDYGHETVPDILDRC
jgi:hypothetical protein